MPRITNSSSMGKQFVHQFDRGPLCWEWKGATVTNEQGQKYGVWRKESAARVSYQMAVGPIPKGMSVYHHCKNSLCVRPQHLFLAPKNASLVKAGY
jgi:hypothetical protein